MFDSVYGKDGNYYLKKFLEKSIHNFFWKSTINFGFWVFGSSSPNIRKFHSLKYKNFFKGFRFRKYKKSFLLRKYKKLFCGFCFLEYKKSFLLRKYKKLSQGRFFYFFEVRLKSSISLNINISLNISLNTSLVAKIIEKLDLYAYFF